MSEEPRRCTFCVMDDIESAITFDDEGRCNLCRDAELKLTTDLFPGEEGERVLESVVDQIKEEGRGREYDCVLGVSGGVDSTYCAYRAIQLGLRPLAVHLDNGWNSELAVNNIEMTIRTLDIDLVTVVVEWEDIRDLQRSFLRASLPDVEVVSDHAICATLYREAAKRSVRYIIAGNNVSGESLMPLHWGYDQRDGRHVRAIHRRFGERKLRTYPGISAARMLYCILLKRIKYVSVLNYGDYNKDEAIKLLQREVDYRPYQRKHGESRFTRFFQEYYLPTKFNFDKRKAHFSSLIVSGQMTRSGALELLEKPLYDPHELEMDIEFVCKKLDFTREEFDEIMGRPARDHWSYPNNYWMFRRSNPITQLIRSFAKGELGRRGGARQLPAKR
ncbi:MAG: N-acetyl sugar amidotransferase [Polyangiaceae bacterium]